jgi:hypothetical protein
LTDDDRIASHIFISPEAAGDGVSRLRARLRVV